ncbi:glycosyltransferase [Halopelagius longus]|uniref:Glycosyl transferase family 2 n=1 Tax=Halopelagius longus TaxID=1236180 RepID=A0A1H1DCA1_9EURY|nr:glycosyltransferase [Halopelagius longus]RDI71269.1 glycosyltransferase [Halopelagius longus]SDQ74072.1 Glycosyl transferase family 2 [Halopelagius longus]
MNRTVGVVVPAYRPDPERLLSYVRSLDDQLTPAVVRIELDDPRPKVLDRLRDAPQFVDVNAVAARRGKGAAITAGFESLASEVDVLAFADADGSTPADSFADVVAPVADGDASLSVGSRRHPRSDIASHQTLARRRLGDGFAWLARRLLDVGLYDYQCGAKAVASDAWANVRDHLYDPGFAWDIELIAVADALDYRIVEVPVRWEDRPGSTVSPVETTFRLARGLLLSRHRARIIREDRVHELLETTRTDRPTLVNRLTDSVEAAEAD